MVDSQILNLDGWVAASRPKALGMVEANGETIPKLRLRLPPRERRLLTRPPKLKTYEGGV